MQTFHIRHCHKSHFFLRRESSREETWIQRSRFLGRISHYIIWYECSGKGVKNELLIRDEQWFLPFQCAPLGPANFMIKKAGKKKQFALLDRNAIQWCIIPNLFSFNKFRSPNIFRTTFFYGQLTCISIDIQNYFYSFVCPKKNACTHTGPGEETTENSRSSTKLVTKKLFIVPRNRK